MFLIGRSTVFPHKIGRFHRDQATAADILAESESARGVRRDSKRIKIPCNGSSRKRSNLAQGTGSRGDSAFCAHIGQFKVA
jgi:hypothetical protein